MLIQHEELAEMPRIIDEIRSAPERIADRGTQMRRKARQRMHAMRLGSEERLFTFRLDTLERFEDLLGRAPEWPGLGRVADAAEKLVHERLAAFTQPPIATYYALNVKEIGQALDTLAYVDLLRVRRWEETHKNRVTVVRAVERELEKRERLPEAQPITAD
jgi:hypothetical protein